MKALSLRGRAQTPVQLVHAVYPQLQKFVRVVRHQAAQGVHKLTDDHTVAGLFRLAYLDDRVDLLLRLAVQDAGLIPLVVQGEQDIQGTLDVAVLGQLLGLLPDYRCLHLFLLF